MNKTESALVLLLVDKILQHALSSSWKFRIRSYAALPYGQRHSKEVEVAKAIAEKPMYHSSCWMHLLSVNYPSTLWQRYCRLLDHPPILRLEWRTISRSRPKRSLLDLSQEHGEIHVLRNWLFFFHFFASLRAWGNHCCREAKEICGQASEPMRSSS